MNSIIMNKYIVSEYYYEDDLFSILPPKSYQNFNEIIQMINVNYHRNNIACLVH